MAKKVYPARSYFIAAGLALAIGLVYTAYLFHVILGPGMLVLGLVFLGIALKKRKAEAAQTPPAP